MSGRLSVTLNFHEGDRIKRVPSLTIIDNISDFPGSHGKFESKFAKHFIPSAFGEIQVGIGQVLIILSSNLTFVTNVDDKRAHSVTYPHRSFTFFTYINGI